MPKNYPPGWGRAWRQIRLATIFEKVPRRGAIVLSALQTGSVEVHDDHRGRLLDADGTEFGYVDYETEIAHVGRPLVEGDLPGKPTVATIDAAFSQTKIHLFNFDEIGGLLRQAGMPITDDGLTLIRGTLIWLPDNRQDGFVAHWVDGEEHSSPLPRPPGAYMAP